MAVILLSAWAIVASAIIIGTALKAQKNEERIFEIDTYLKARIMRETGQNLYKDLK